MNEIDDNFAKLSLLTIDVFFKQLLMYFLFYFKQTIDVLFLL
jgi:hypothetical protein